MLNFEKLDYGNLSSVKTHFMNDNNRYLSAGADIICDRVCGTTFLWRDYYQTKFALYGDAMILQTVTGGTEMYSLPFGTDDIEKTLAELREYCHNRGETLYFCFVPEEDLHYFHNVFDVVFTTDETDWCDYVYTKTDLSEFSGRRFHRQKNHVNKFIKTVPDAEFTPITPENSSLVLDYARSWYSKYSDNSQMSNAEEKAVYDILDRWEVNSCFTGGFVNSSLGILGFTIGECAGNTVYIHIEKAEHDKSGAYQFLSSEYLKSITDDKIKYVNREEDMGIEGLRKSKQSLHPVRLLKKYTLYCC